ncbi:MAG: nucleoside-diphosphate kinase [Acidobacteria bacterium]|nr:nucleoside-diphosphate kinase [Acidobacteriota bacterium]MCY3966837.1 nucleoside-diphosphate kinase [Acidobacteriota bacterium]
MEETLTIIKPDAVRAGNAGRIIAHLEDAGFVIQAIRRVRLSRAQAEAFYAVHRERPFFAHLVDFMTSGPAIALALARENAVAHLRDTMGATDSAQAAPGTIRNLYGRDIQNNAIHGSDSPENASAERAFFFAGCDLVG